jgi:hypothetical protein
LYNPYDNARRWATSWENPEVTWAGEDCSYVTAYAAAARKSRLTHAAAGLLAAALALATAALGAPLGFAQPWGG